MSERRPEDEMAATQRPNADEVRKIVKERLDAGEQTAGVGETVRVEWRGQELDLLVITMPVDLLAYNPDTHRIRAQRTLDPDRDSVLTAEPFGDEAQAYLHQLLKGDPADPSKTDTAFDELKDDLSLHGQKEPGVINREGILVNGNTRRAALKELGEPNMRVGVLPSDAGIEDIQAVELALQLRKIIRREYSFMNRLLAIEERMNAGWPRDKILKELHMKSPTLERNLWILQTVRDVIDRSKVDGGAGAELSLRYVDFESDQGKLEELYGTYSTLKTRSPDEAEALKEQRLLAIARHKSKTDVRLIEADFSDKYPKMQSLLKPKPGGTEPRPIPGTTIIPPSPTDRVQALRELTTSALKARAVMENGSNAAPAEVSEATAELQAIDDVLEPVLDQAGRDGRVRKRRFAPADRLSDANDDLKLVLEAVADARATGNFAADDLDDGLLTLKSSLERLAQQVERSDANGGEGVAWLKDLLARTANLVA
jgi:hypothetical protein